LKGVDSSQKRIAIIWTKFLPYHVARIRHLRKRLLAINWRLTAIEMASKDALYPFPEASSEPTEDYICLFSGKSYRALSASTLHASAYRTLENITPDVVIAPSTPFPSGMAAVKYCLVHEKLSVMMDDAWEFSDRRGHLISLAKKIIHRNIDVAFIPAPSHAAYYVEKGFPKERIVYGVDVVDNDFFAAAAARARVQTNKLREDLGLPEKYFLFVGRFIKRKGISTLLKAYREYIDAAPNKPWGIVLVGEGDEVSMHEKAMERYPSAKFVGSQFGDLLSAYYGLASAFILPSEVETWGLVVNEAMASGLPVLASTGCGSGRALIEEGKNGWTFKPGNHEQLTNLMTRLSQLPPEQLRSMGTRSEEIISGWSLDTFADSVIRASQFTRRDRGGALANFLTKAWTGRISFYP
jgi:glycosyltransferase involved in cell wall biosynthesis